MKKDAIIRVGDQISMGPGVYSVKRVGYPLAPQDVSDEMIQEHEDLKEIYQLLINNARLTSKAYIGILDKLRYEYASRAKFGGPERTVHYDDVELLEGTYEVEDIRYKQVGVRVPGGGSMYSWGYDPPDYEPPHLSHNKTVKLLLVMPVDVSKKTELANAFLVIHPQWVNAEHVQKVNPQ